MFHNLPKLLYRLDRLLRLYPNPFPLLTLVMQEIRHMAGHRMFLCTESWNKAIGGVGHRCCKRSVIQIEIQRITHQVYGNVILQQHKEKGANTHPIEHPPNSSARGKSKECQSRHIIIFRNDLFWYIFLLFFFNFQIRRFLNS